MEKFTSTKAKRIGIEPGSTDEIIALRRLIEYAVDEAERNGLVSCARVLRTARQQIGDAEIASVDVYARFLEGRSHLPS